MSVPIAAALILKGLSPGAALVFLISGPATNAAAITTIWKILGHRTAVIYLATVAVSALASGLLLDQLISPTALADTYVHEMLPGFVKVASAVLLIGVLGAALFPRRHKQDVPPHAHTVVLQIAGMTCSHCARSVRAALLECPAVASADVDLDAARATISGGEFDMAHVRRAVQELGYEVVSVNDA